MLNLGLGIILGLVLGSFGGCLAYRSLKGETFFGRSYCESCKKTLRWYDLLPVLSYLLLRGHCRYCHKKIPIDNLLFEILMGLLIGLIFFRFLPEDFYHYTLTQSSLIIGDVLFKVFIVTVLMILFLTDLKEGLIPDSISKPATVISFFYLVIVTIYQIILLYQSLQTSTLGKLLLPPSADYFYRHAEIYAETLRNSLLSALAVGLFFGGLIVFTRGRGMGGGDLKLGIFIGLGLGFPGALVAIMLAFISGSLVSILLLAARVKRLGQTVPFGPFLSFGAVVALIWGQQIVDWYSQLFSIGPLFIQ